MDLRYREAILFPSNYGGVSFDIWLYQPMTGHIFKLIQNMGEEFSVPYWSPRKSIKLNPALY